MTDQSTNGTDRLSEEDRCDKCGEIPQYDKTSTNPLTGDEEERYECECGWTTVVIPR